MRNANWGRDFDWLPPPQQLIIPCGMTLGNTCPDLQVNCAGAFLQRNSNDTLERSVSHIRKLLTRGGHWGIITLPILDAGRLGRSMSRQGY